MAEKQLRKNKEDFYEGWRLGRLESEDRKQELARLVALAEDAELDPNTDYDGRIIVVARSEMGKKERGEIEKVAGRPVTFMNWRENLSRLEVVRSERDDRKGLVQVYIDYLHTGLNTIVEDIEIHISWREGEVIRVSWWMIGVDAFNRKVVFEAIEPLRRVSEMRTDWKQTQQLHVEIVYEEKRLWRGVAKKSEPPLCTFNESSAYASPRHKAFADSLFDMRGAGVEAGVNSESSP